jgi:hypothetical protein
VPVKTDSDVKKASAAKGLATIRKHSLNFLKGQETANDLVNYIFSDTEDLEEFVNDLRNPKMQSALGIGSAAYQFYLSSNSKQQWVNGQKIRIYHADKVKWLKDKDASSLPTAKDAIQVIETAGSMEPELEAININLQKAGAEIVNVQDLPEEYMVSIKQALESAKEDYNEGDETTKGSVSEWLLPAIKALKDSDNSRTMVNY